MEFLHISSKKSSGRDLNFFRLCGEIPGNFSHRMTASDVNSIGTFPGNFSTECTKSMELPHGVAPWALRMVEQFTLGDSVRKTPGNFPTE